MFTFAFCPQRLLRLSSSMLLSGLSLLLLGLIGAYGLEQQLNLATLVLAHSLTIIGPALLKLGYVLRLAAQQGLPEQEGCCAVT